MESINTLITEEEIKERVRTLAVHISREYENRPLTIVAVLTGGLVFLADIIRQLTIPHRIATMRASSYRGETTTAGRLEVEGAFLPDLTGRDVLLLDDILDTGKTLSFLVTHAQDRGAASVKTLVLLHKVGTQEVPCQADYVGFEIPNEFVIGYGMDYDDDYRHLPYIGVLGE